MAKNRESKTTKQYKDHLLRRLYQDRNNALELCRALTGKDYPEETNIEQCDLNSTLASHYNDVAFIVDDELLFIIEHQSTINENMPLRILSYVIDILYASFVNRKELFKTTLFKIPTPKVYVLYNGEAPLKKKRLKLSDAFKLKEAEDVALELIVPIYDVNYNGTDRHLFERSKSLEGYAYLIDQIRKFRNDHPRDVAIKLAIEKCIKEDVLATFLQTYDKDVINMLKWEYDKEVERQALVEQGLKQGLEQGLEQGFELRDRQAQEEKQEIAATLLEKGMNPEEVSSILNITLN